MTNEKRRRKEENKIGIAIRGIIISIIIIIIIGNGNGAGPQNSTDLWEGIPSVVHDGVVVVSEAEGVDLLRGQLVEVVVLA